uniref:Contactin 1b n=1 Tax=Oreochromis niloticus TaxID=8128 RepID=A0A669EIN9_ORENI
MCSPQEILKLYTEISTFHLNPIQGHTLHIHASVSRSFCFSHCVMFDIDATGYGPIFEEEPVDVVYIEDSPDGRISMNCRARANPPATYRWRRDNWEIKLMEQPDEHYSLVGGNLVITNPIQKKHAGTYVCVAKNIYGTVISKEARVKFGCEYNNIISEMQSRKSVPCISPSFCCLSEEVTYRWIYNEFPVFLNTDRRRFVSQKTGNLYIAKVEAQDAGNYSCFVSSPVLGKSVFSKFIPLIPLPPDDGEERKYPADIRVKFPDTTAMLASNITLECFALGNPIPHIVWRKVDATDLPANHEISESGAVLHLFNVQYEDVGFYECEAINTKGKDWHKACDSHCVFPAAPEWAETINNTMKDIGSEHTMRCVASGKPFPFIRWYKDGYMYGKGELKFSSLTFADSGMYQCIAENYWGIKYANAELRVIACAPTFEFNPVKKQLLGAKDGRVVIECKPRAAPRPRFTWTKGKELLYNSSRISIMFDGSLEILNATKNDEGVYTCFAENDRGKANSSGYLTITEATSITVAPEDTEAKVGDEVILKCEASYDPMLDITFIWAIDFRVIDFNSEWQQYERNEDGVGDLKILNAQIWHEGRYTCTAQTVVDSDTAYCDLKVVGVPGPPGVIRVEEIGDTWVKLWWTKGAEHNSPILYYTIQTRHYWALYEDDWRNASTSPTVLDGSMERAEVTDLYPWMEYQFRIIATNEYGSGEASIPSLKIKTWDAPPVVSPTNLAGYGGRNGEIIITWTPVEPWYFYGKKFGYIVAFKPHDAYDWWYETISDPETRRHVHRDTYFIPTEEDFQVREFQVKIKSFNVKGDGPYTLTKVIYYPRDVPIESPTDIYARPVSSTEALVWWLPVVDTGTGLQQYWRKYDDPEPGANRIFVSASVNQTRLENMLPDSHYLIEVRAYNGAGLGPPGEMCEMFTKRPRKTDDSQMWRYISWTGKWLYVWWDHIQYDWFGNISFPLYYKVMFRKSGYIYGKVYITGWHFMDFPMPQVGDYELMVRGRYEGGDGPIRRIKILGHASTITPTLSLVSLVLLALCVVGLEI